MTDESRQSPRRANGGISREQLLAADRRHLEASRGIDISSCQSVCLILGPYRNLTTLTAATLFLHPDCQVLNHAGVRILGHPQLDFLSDFSRRRLDRFIQFAILISQGGRRGEFGGSITLSHAFDAQYAMRSVMSGKGVLSRLQPVKCVVWKESLAVSNLIRRKDVDLAAILSADPRPRFLMPVRNPLDCASSNLKTGHYKRFPELDDSATFAEVLRAVIDEIRRFAAYQRAFPDRFYMFFEHAISREMLGGLIDFIGLNPLEQWFADALSVMVNRSDYRHDRARLQLFRDMAQRQLEDFPELLESLLKFNRDGY